jgi:hypothetical protein
MRTKRQRLALLMALLPGLVPLLAVWAGGAGKGAIKTEYFSGQVVMSKDLAAKPGVKLDAAAHPRALVANDGKIHPLVNDAGARMFLTDDKLLRRPMRLTGRLLDANVLQVVQVHSLLKGKLHEVYYWCEVCAIKRFEGGICDCCGDKLEFREVAVKE